MMIKCEFEYRPYWTIQELIRYCLDDLPPQLKELLVNYDEINKGETVEELKADIRDLEDKLDDIRFICG